MEINQDANGVSETQNQVSDQNEVTSEAPRDENPYDNHNKRLLAETKKAKQQARELEAELKKYKEQELRSKNNLEQLLQDREQELKEKDDAYKRLTAEMTAYRVKSKVAEIATKLGAIDAEDVVEKFRISDFDFSEDGTVDARLIEKKVGELKTAKKHLFKDEKIRVADGNPPMRPDSITKDSIKSMKSGDLETLLRSLDKK